MDPWVGVSVPAPPTGAPKGAVVGGTPSGRTPSGSTSSGARGIRVPPGALPSIVGALDSATHQPSDISSGSSHVWARSMWFPVRGKPRGATGRTPVKALCPFVMQAPGPVPSAAVCAVCHPEGAPAWLWALPTTRVKVLNAIRAATDATGASVAQWGPAVGWAAVVAEASEVTASTRDVANAVVHGAQARGL